MTEHEEMLARRTIIELRTLLDLSYARERQLATALTKLLLACEGAAFAPEKSGDVSTTIAEANSALEALRQTPVPNHGLFTDYARLAAELSAARKLNQSLNGTLDVANRANTELHDRARDMQQRLIEAEATRDAVVSLLNKPEMADVVMRSAVDLARARTSNRKPA